MAKPRQKEPRVGVDSVRRSNTTPIVLGAAGLVLLLGLVALVIAQPWKSSNNSADSNILEFQPVTVTGSPLPSEYSDAQGQQLNVAVGAQAPELSGKTFDGQPVTIKADGKPKVVLFVAHWCPHCQREVPILSQWLRDNMSKYPNVEFYAVATASSPAKPNYPPSAWLQKEKWPTTIMADDNNSSAAAAYGLGAYPYMVVLDGNNKVITRTSGELSTTDFANKIVGLAK